MPGDRAVTFTASSKDDESAPLLETSGAGGHASPPDEHKETKGNGFSKVDYSRRRSSTARLAIERLARTRERLWSTAVSSLIGAIPALLVGFTIGFPSPVLTELTSDSVDEKYKFDNLMSDLFAVSETHCGSERDKSYLCQQLVFVRNAKDMFCLVTCMLLQQ